MNRNELIQVLADQQELKWSDQNIKRTITAKLPIDNNIVVISGIRRCGKSTLLNEIRTMQKENNYYLNFDDERLFHFSLDDFQLLYELFIELFGVQKIFYFDEIQNIKGWERFIRRLHDYGNKVYITGSNASMLSKELGTHLTGRYYQFELLPFSFSEYLSYKNIVIDKNIYLSTKDKASIINHYKEYFDLGGFPAYIAGKNKDYLKSLYESILYRDVLVRNNLTNEKELLELVYYLISNTSKLISYNSLTKVIGVKSATTIKNYLEYLQSTYLVFFITKFDFSVKKQIQNPKKIYFIDIALTKELGFHFSENRGRLLENLVFIELRRREKDIFYHKQKYECDFIIRKGISIIDAIQVSKSLYDNEVREREIRGLIEALEAYKLNIGILLTEYEEDSIKIKDKEIKVLPVWKWLLLD
jgi:predicted AAA+ superfamily ATPase